jgi:hypothetical protein
LSDAAEKALLRLQEATQRVLQLVKGASYGFRVGAKRIGDLTVKGGPLTSVAKSSPEEMHALLACFESVDENMTEVVSLALGDHFREYLRAALSLKEAPPLPQTPEEVEKLAGVPGALSKVPFEFRLLLQLYAVTMRGGILDRAALERLGVQDLQLFFAGGKVKMFREGDRVALSEDQFTAMNKAALEAARAVRMRLQAS